MKTKTVLVFSVCLTVAAANILGHAYKQCGDSLECIEKQFKHELDVIDSQENVEVLGSYVRLRRVTSQKEMETSRSINEGLVERVSRFLNGREMDIKFPTTLASARKIFSDARSSKLKKFIIPFVVLMILKKSIEVPIFLAVLSILSFKGLAAGLISLVLSGATAFKSLLEHHHSTSKVSYEVVPQLSSSHWSRSGIDYPNFDGYHTIA